MSWLSRMAERQIAKARLQGQLQGLAGEGKPLPDRTGDALSRPGMRLAFALWPRPGFCPKRSP